MSQVRRQSAVLPRPNWGWQDAAACRGEDLLLFFGPDGERQPERDIRERKAKEICAACPVRARVPQLRRVAAGEVRHLGRPERGRAGGRASPPDAPGQRGLNRCGPASTEATRAALRPVPSQPSRRHDVGVGQLAEGRIPLPHGGEPAGRGQDDHLVRLGAHGSRPRTAARPVPRGSRCAACAARSDAQCGPRGAAGRQAVVHHDHAPARDRRAAACRRR